MGKLVYTDQQTGMEVSIPFGPERPIVTIGRATECTIRSNRKSVSRHHAEFHYNNGRYEVLDLNSSNGTFIVIDNERRPVVHSELLAHADEVWCGDFVLHFYDDSDMTDYPPMPNDLDSTFNRSAGDAPFAQHHQSAYPDAGHGNLGSGPHHYDLHDPYANDSLNQDSFVMDDESFGINMPRGGADDAQLQQLQNEKAQLEAQTSELSAQIQTLEQKCATQAQELEDLRQELDHHLQASVSSEEYERLAQELQAAQAQESQLQAAQQQVSELRTEIQRLEDQLAQAPQSSATEQEVEHLKDRIQQNQRDIEILEDAVESAQHELLQSQKELTAAQKELTAAQKDLTTVQKELQAAQKDLLSFQKELHTTQKERDLAQKDIELLEQKLEASQQTLTALQEEASQAVQQSTSSKISEEANALRSQLDKSKRLIHEFERRNRELQTDLERTAEQLTAVQQQLHEKDEALAASQKAQDALEKKLAQAIDDASTREQELEQKLAQAIDDASAREQELEQKLAQLFENAEKQRDDLQEKVLAAQSERDEVLESMSVELDKLRAQAAAQAPINEQLLTTIREKVDTLDRIVDAIVRTDLSALSTVDRIRLQSAIRETQPQQTLQALRKLASVTEEPALS